MGDSEKNLFEQFLNVLNALTEQKVDYILIGGVAVILRGMDRLTRDIDIMIKLEKDNIDRLQQALKSVFHDDEIDQITLDELKKYPVIRYGTPEGFYIDLMTKIGEAFAFNDIQMEIISIDGISIKIGTIQSLIQMKKDTLRPQDKLDARFLISLGEKKEK